MHCNARRGRPLLQRFAHPLCACYVVPDNDIHRRFADPLSLVEGSMSRIGPIFALFAGDGLVSWEPDRLLCAHYGADPRSTAPVQVPKGVVVC